MKRDYLNNIKDFLSSLRQTKKEEIPKEKVMVFQLPMSEIKNINDYDWGAMVESMKVQASAQEGSPRPLPCLVCETRYPNLATPITSDDLNLETVKANFAPIIKQTTDIFVKINRELNPVSDLEDIDSLMKRSEGIVQIYKSQETPQDENIPPIKGYIKVSKVKVRMAGCSGKDYTYKMPIVYENCIPPFYRHLTGPNGLLSNCEVVSVATVPLITKNNNYTRKKEMVEE